MTNTIATRRSWHDDCRVTGFVQPGETEHWRVSNFTVSEGDSKWASLTAIIGSSRRGSLPPGEYTRLDRKHPGGSRSIVMSDTRDEINDLGDLFWKQPYGRVLVHGLGLGCVVKGLLARPEVTHIDVVEIDPEVIELVGSQYTDPRLSIHLGDAFTYDFPKGTSWDFAWHDVWDSLSTDNLSNEEHAQPGTYAKLNRRYARRVAWQGAWGQEYLRKRAAQDRRQSWYF